MGAPSHSPLQGGGKKPHLHPRTPNIKPKIQRAGIPRAGFGEKDSARRIRREGFGEKDSARRIRREGFGEKDVKF
jgi:hypothetical protein